MELFQTVKKVLKIAVSLNWYTFYINFKFLPLKSAVKLPILILGGISVHSFKGKIIISGDVSFGMIRFGEGKVGVFDKKLRTVFDINGTIHFRGQTRIGHGCGISIGENSCLELGDMFKITAKSQIICSDSCKIIFGSGCLLSWDVLIMTTDFHPIFDSANGKFLNPAADVIIGDNVWLGSRSTVLKGVRIASNSVLASNSCITRSAHDEGTIYAGCPAKPIRSGISWEWH